MVTVDVATVVVELMVIRSYSKPVNVNVCIAVNLVNSTFLDNNLLKCGRLK